MANLLIQSLGCPNCGAPYNPKTRNCRFCGSVLIVTSLAETFTHNLDAHQVSVSLDKWRKLLKVDTENAKAHYALGLTYLNSKLRDAALTHLRKAVLLAPEVADTHYNLAITLMDDGNKSINSPEYAEAVKEIDYSNRLAPDFREAQAFRHFILARKLDEVDNQQALAEYIKAAKTCSDIAMLQNNLGFCLFKSNNLADAEVCFRRAITLNPNDYGAYTNLCVLMYRKGMYKEGIEAGMKAVANSGAGKNANAYDILALCLWKSKRKLEALEYIKKAIAIEPDNPRYKENLKKIQESSPLKSTFNTTVWIIIIIAIIYFFIQWLWWVNH